MGVPTSDTSTLRKHSAAKFEGRSGSHPSDKEHSWFIIIVAESLIFELKISSLNIQKLRRKIIK